MNRWMNSSYSEMQNTSQSYCFCGSNNQTKAPWSDMSMEKRRPKDRLLQETKKDSSLTEL